MLHFFCIGAELSVDPLFDQDWFYCCIPKDDPSGEQTVDDGEGDLYCNEFGLVFSRREEYKQHLHILLLFETSKAPIGSSFAAGGTHLPTGLKDMFLCSDLAGDEPRTCS